MVGVYLCAQGQGWKLRAGAQSAEPAQVSKGWRDMKGVEGVYRQSHEQRRLSEGCVLTGWSTAPLRSPLLSNPW